MKQQNVRVCSLSGERGDGDLLPTVNGARQGQGTGKSPRVRPHGSPTGSGRRWRRHSPVKGRGSSTGQLPCSRMGQPGRSPGQQEGPSRSGASRRSRGGSVRAASGA